MLTWRAGISGPEDSLQKTEAEGKFVALCKDTAGSKQNYLKNHGYYHHVWIHNTCLEFCCILDPI